jgi:hypothetical protein
MNGEQTGIWKEKDSRDLLEGSIPKFTLRDWKKPRKDSVSMARKLAEI